jgi:uncharacterized damage-inducible protein DinB
MGLPVGWRGASRIESAAQEARLPQASMRRARARKQGRPESRADRTLLEQILQAWRVNSSINVKLVRGIPQKGFDAIPSGSRGRTVARQLTHMHKVHVGWLRYNGVKLGGHLKPFDRNATPTRAQLVSAFRASGRAVEAFVRERLLADGRVGFFQGKPIRWMCYLIAHDSHHRGQIALALKQNGMRLPQNVAINDIWYSWYGGDPE